MRYRLLVFFLILLRRSISVIAENMEVPASAIASFNCGTLTCSTARNETCDVTIFERKGAVTEACNSIHLHWETCKKLECYLDKCRVYIINTWEGRRKSPLVTCETVYQEITPTNNLDEYAITILNPYDYQLWAILGVFVGLVPALFMAGVLTRHFNKCCKSTPAKKMEEGLVDTEDIVTKEEGGGNNHHPPDYTIIQGKETPRRN